MEQITVTYDVYHQYLIHTVILEHIFVIKWLYPKWKVIGCVKIGIY